jgi:hypothetical protein
MTKSSKIFSFTAAAVVFIAVIIGSTSKLAPHLFFRVPNIGFILYAVTGSGPIPPYIVQDPFLEESRGWLKQDDVVVSIGAKSGTTWMLYCSHQIRSKGNEEKHPFEDIMLNTPWVGLVQTPGEDWETLKGKMNTTVLPDGTRVKDYWDHDDYPFRIFKSHDVPGTYGDLIGGDKVKFLAMARNGLDMASSMVPFFDNHSNEFRKLWGNFPPVWSDTPEEEASKMMNDLLPGGILGHLYFEYVNEWWKARNEKNVLLLHYSDAKKDLKGTVKKIADFYGMKLNKEELNNVVEKCSFEHMKKNKNLFNYQIPLNKNFKGTLMKPGKMIRKGSIGDGKVGFSEQERDRWAKAEEEMFGDNEAKLRWAREGGTF